MDSIFFSAKRTHYSALRFTRPLLAEFGLTPARFDVLSAICEFKCRTQRVLRLALGCARATMSEMLGALERIGLVERERDPDDRRTFLVRITAVGLKAMNDALEKHVNSGFVPLRVDAIITHDYWRDDELFERDQIDGAMFHIFTAFGDTSKRLHAIDLDLVEGAVTDLNDPKPFFMQRLGDAL